MTIGIRDSVAEDRAALEALYPQAFPEEELLPLVHALLQDAAVAMSLVATIDTQVAGHAIFTRCRVNGNGVPAALLGPLAVAPAHQRQGVGSALVRAGLRRLGEEAVALVCVLGDPAYYVRFGFNRESSIEPPYPLPAEWRDAWQSKGLGAAATSHAGKLIVPLPWREPALWAP